MELLGYTSSEWLRLASQPQRGNVGPAPTMAAIPVASGIETRCESLFTSAFDTTAPDVRAKK